MERLVDMPGRTTRDPGVASGRTDQAILRRALRILRPDRRGGHRLLPDAPLLEAELLAGLATAPAVAKRI